jgi:outer membrane protein OmpU
MRKLLLSTTALITAATLSSAAFADVSITGAMEFTYENRDYSTSVATTGASNDDFSLDQNISIKFTSKTDTGLEIGMISNMQALGDAEAPTLGGFTQDEAYIYVKGGFGEITLGQRDGAGDRLTVSAGDLMPSDGTSDNGSGMNGSLNLATDNADLYSGSYATTLSKDDADLNKITYMLPTMGGVSLGVSYSDAGNGAANNDDITQIGASYAFESGAVKGSLHYGSQNVGGKNAGDPSLNASSVGAKISSGPITAIVARASIDVSSSVTTTVTDYGISYNAGNGFTLAAAGTQIDENTGGETADITSIQVKYNIASGLDAFLTYHDYDYQDGTTAITADDDGSVTLLTVKASF